MSIQNLNKTEALKNAVGERFKETRLRLNLSQADLANLIGVSQATIANIERGTIFPKLEYLDYLNHEYNINLTWLITGRKEVKKVPDLGDRYRELVELMRNPEIESIILSKAREIKLFMKNKI